MYANNVDFTGSSTVTPQVTLNGQLLIGNSVAPNIRVGAITSPKGTLTVGYAAPNLTLDVNNLVIPWNKISSNQTLVVNNGYICYSGGTLTLLLPLFSTIGQELEITLDGSTGFSITQNAGQSIRFGSSVTSAGVGGSLSSTAQGDTLRLVCTTANIRWNVVSSIGNLTIV